MDPSCSRPSKAACISMPVVRSYSRPVVAVRSMSCEQSLSERAVHPLTVATTVREGTHYTCAHWLHGSTRLYHDQAALEMITSRQYQARRVKNRRCSPLLLGETAHAE